VRAIRLIALSAASCLFAGAIAAAPQQDQIPTRLRPALQLGQKLAETSQTSAKDPNKSRKKANTGNPKAVRSEYPASRKAPQLSRNLPLPAARRLAASTSRARAPGSVGSSGNAYPAGAPGSVKPVGRPTPPLVGAVAAMPSPMDLAAVKQAIELVRKDQPDEATGVEKTISDPLARKLTEWLILRNDENGVAFSRYAAFVAANPTWPSLVTLRRHAEAALWQQDIDPQATIAFLSSEPPLSGKGYFAEARAWLAKGDAGRAAAAVRAAWRTSSFSDEVETQARATFAGLITPTDDKVRMEARLYVGDDEAAQRAARHLGSADQAIAKAFAAAGRNAGNAGALLEAVPQQARRDPAYMFSRIHWLRHHDRIKDAAQLMLTVPRDPVQLIDLDQWWVERRLLARKLLDLGQARTAYKLAAEAVAPRDENYRADQQFTAGWIALEFLRDPALALPHFARIADGEVNPITLARSYYWQGRAAQALRRDEQARAAYERAARFPTAYYGQLARAQLRLTDVAPTEFAPPPASRRPLELGRAFEMLYAIDQRDLVASMAADVADKTTDEHGLAALAAITARHDDARSTLLIGKAALGRGFAFARYAFPNFGVPNYRQVGPQVERALVFSIVRQESAFDTRIVSPAHALGLMQVTPSAGRNTARKFKVPFDQRRLLNDVAYNTQLGTAELGDDINAFRGSYILAFVAYNAGQRRAEEWIEQYGDPRRSKVDPIDWIERIPIMETRYYVERVLENMQVYRALLKDGPNLSIEADMRRGS
jgi:soluble lytic murein transglycosylase